MQPMKGARPVESPAVGLRGVIAGRPLASFVVLAYALSWAWWWPLLLAEAPVRPGIGWPSHLPGLLGPAIAAAIVVAATKGRRGLADWAARLVRWRVGAWWWAVVVVAVAGVAAALATRAGGQSGSWTAYPGFPEAWGPLTTVLIVLVVNGIGEEAGWRGFAVEHLARTRSLLVTALWVAVAWALWHLPLFFVLDSFRSFGPGGVIGWTLGLTSGSIVLTWLYLRGGRSVLLVAAWHTAFNFTSATPAASSAMAATTSTLVMIAAVGIVVLELVAARRGRSGARDARGVDTETRRRGGPSAI